MELTPTDYAYEGRWWRFDAYEWRAGRIVPASGAQLESYDPWEALRDEKEAWSRRPESPLTSLAELLNGFLRWQADTEQVRPIVRDGVVTGQMRRNLLAGDYLNADQAGREALLAWCARWGLLALPLHEAATIRLAPRWQRWSPLQPPAPTSTSYTRTARGWQKTVTPLGELSGADHVADGELVSRDLWQRARPAAEPQVTMGWVETGESEGWPLTVWAPHFPSIAPDEAETFAYPLPASPEFWQLYAEDANDFFDAAEALFDALSYFERCPDERSARMVNRFLEQVSPIVGVAVDADFRVAGRAPLRPRISYASPSLMSMLCMMAIEERISESARIVRCEGCGQVIRTAAYQQRYCSERCKWRTKKRRSRAQRSGQPPEEAT